MKWLRDELVRQFEQWGTERDQLRDRVVELEAELRDRVAESEKLKNRVTDLEQALQTLSYNHAQDGREDSR